MKNFSPYKANRHRAAARRGGFTLIEILVAVAIMALLLVIILVPLRLGFESYHIGLARTAVQQEAQLTLQQMGKDFSRASFVFPNSRIPGISDNTTDSTSACSLLAYPNVASGWKFLPYFKSEVVPAAGSDTDPETSGIGVTNQTTPPLKAIANPNRIDMLFLRRPTQSEAGKFSVTTGEDYVVTYYSRRVDIKKAYDQIDNPIVLFRAQYPYRYYKSPTTTPSTTASTAGFFKFPETKNPPTTANTWNAEIDWSKYPALGAAAISPATDAEVNRNFLWITHNYYGEANLEPLTRDVIPSVSSTQDTISRSHTLAIPRGMQLVAPKANTNPLEANAFMPELSFVESSTSGNRIDRVTVNMTLAQYDQAGAGAVNGAPKAQRVPVSQTFDLPNTTCTN